MRLWLENANRFGGAVMSMDFGGESVFITGGIVRFY